MKPKVLVTAASRHEATLEIAEAIATGLRHRSVNAQARPIADLTAHGALDGYTAVVVGSAVYLGRWLGEARRFVQVHASTLCMMPVWLFSSGPLGPSDHLIPAGEPADVQVLKHLSRAVAHRTFPGRLEMNRLDFAERTVARTIHAPEGDCRDWEAIDRFAAEIAQRLLRLHQAA